MNENWQRHAIEKLIGCMNAKIPTGHTIEFLSNQSDEMLAMTAGACIELVHALKQAGAKIACRDGSAPIVLMDPIEAAILINQQLKKRDSTGLSISLQSLAAALDGAAYAGYKAELQSAGVVEIASLPTRITDSTVTRNRSGDIVSTSSVERDAVIAD
jgi:hypothetical protein